MEEELSKRHKADIDEDDGVKVFMSCQHTREAYRCVRKFEPESIKASFPGFNRPSDSLDEKLEFEAFDAKVYAPSVTRAIVRLFQRPQFDRFRGFLNDKLK
jgi:hypothetical protein